MLTPGRGEGGVEATLGRNLVDQRRKLQPEVRHPLDFQPEHLMQDKVAGTLLAGRGFLQRGALLLALHFALLYFGQVTLYKHKHHGHPFSKYGQ